MGRVRVRYFGFLAGEMGKEVEVEVGEAARVEDVVKLPEGMSLDDVVVLVNGVAVKKGEAVRPGDVVSVMPHISGGTRGLPA
ncbi:MAG: MoaD/ThiS family protein [Desulfurococcales archaeon]|nr:MoaD/ThiS family protein [Desulfurococcales archaeon]MCE4605461.1 MoaD/ThiS family protein [Desulfurococcales archaeon]